ncbi:basic salivary proline-rich protein 2-like [Mustela putorius furo]|uniref:Basic salivary proline-rich protein 2-like n=1 Tax=Mustela putorius furo TaxID=9669 RepID=A0A8U0SJ51_MUSPF|nr:basic salivary proline-rich protein 2-like [Mustela putorius furo]
MILGPRSPRKHQIHLHLEGKQKTPSRHHTHPLHPRRRREPSAARTPKKAPWRTSAPEPKTRGSPWPRQPRKPSHLHSSAASRPHCRDPTEFPVSDNDAISVREETHNKPGGRRRAGCPPRGPPGPAERVGAPEGRAAPLPSRSRPGPEGPRVGAAERPGGPEGRGQDRPAAQPLPTSRSEAETRQVRVGSPAPGPRGPPEDRGAGSRHCPPRRPGPPTAAQSR